MAYISKLFIYIFSLAIGLYIFILSVDPYDKYGFNFWKLKTKAVNSYRDNKFYQIDSTKINYDLFILGSSRVQAFNPELIEKHTGLKTFNYGVNNSKPEDLLAITKHIIAKQSPRVIFLQLDFYNLNKHIPMDGRLRTSPLKQYLDDNVKSKINSNKFYYFEQNYTTLISLKDSITLIIKNKLGKTEVTHKDNGMKVGYKPKEKPNLAEPYFRNEYKNYEFGEKRIKYFNQLKTLCDKNNIDLLVSISAMNKEHTLRIVKDEYLFKQFLNFKRIVVNIFEKLYDFNTFASFKYNYPYWTDSVHPSIELPKVMSSKIFNRYGYSNEYNIPKDFGVLVTKENIDQHLKNLKKQVENYDLNKTF